MASDLTDGDSLQGVLIPDERLTFWSSQSSGVTEASPYPGIVTPDRTTRATVTASGTPVDEDTLYLLALQGGITGHSGARFAWRAGTSESYRGWDPPTCIADHEVPTFSSSATQGYYHPSVAALSDGSLIVAVDNPSSSKHRVRVRVRSAAGVWGSWVTPYSQVPHSSTTADYLHPRLVVRSDDVIELYHVRTFESAAQIWRHTSSDGGATWEIDAVDMLDAAVAISSREVRGFAVAYGSGQWLGMLWTDNRSDTSDEIQHFACRDGATFETQGSAIQNESRPAVIYCQVQGRFVAVSRETASTHDTQIRDAGSAFASTLHAAAPVTGQAGRRDDEIALAEDEIGTLYILSRFDADTVRISKHDQIVTRAVGVLLEPNPFDGDEETVSEFSATFCRGQVIVASNNDEPGNPHSVSIAWLGGYTDVEAPAFATTAAASTRDVWLPVNEIDHSGTYATGHTGSPTYTAGGEFQSTTGSTGETAKFDNFSTGTFNNTRLRGRARVNAVSSRLRVRMYAQSGGTTRYGLQIRITGGALTDLVELRDTAGGTIIATTTVTAGSTIDYLAELDNGGNGIAYIRTVGTDSAERRWTLLGSTSSLTSASANNSGVTFTMDNSLGTGSFDVDLGFQALQRHSYSDELMGKSYPDDLTGRALLPVDVYVHDGISLRCSGLVRGGDTWSVAPRHSYEIERALPTEEPSPARGWRSTGTGSTTLAFQLDSLDDAEIGPLIGIFLDEHNLTNLTVQVAHGVSSPTWSTVASSELAYGQVDYQRLGSTMIPRGSFTGSEEEFHTYRDELAGGYVRFQSNNTTREIVRNGEGTWISNATPANHWPSLELAGVQSGDPTSGEFQTNTGIYVHSRRAMVVISLPDADRKISGIRITFGGTYAPPQGYWEIGTLAIGPIHVLGWRPDSTRSRALSLGQVLEAQADGSAYARQERGDAVRMEIAWTRTSATFEAATHDLDYVKARNHASAIPVAARWLGPQSFRGLLSQVGRGPIVYVPRIPYTTSDEHFLLHRYAGGAMLARFVPESYRLESVGTQLPEEGGELLRSSVITLEECL